MPTIRKPKLKFSGTLTLRNQPRTLVIHHAAAQHCSIEDIHQWHLNRGWIGCGYHYLIRKDGSIYQGRPQEANGAHAVGMNAVSLGICLEGDYSVESEVPLAQLRSLVDLCRLLDLPVKFHREVGSTQCPGSNFPEEDFHRRLAEENQDAESMIDCIILQLQQLRSIL